MASLPEVVLQRGREGPVRRFHPWIFSGAVGSTTGNPTPGDMVIVRSPEGAHLATGFFEGGSIAVKIFSFGERAIDQSFWTEAIAGAWALRHTLGLTTSETTDSFRLVNAEGDGLPGLIIDLYGRTAVLQFHSRGMQRARDQIVRALEEVLGERLGAIYDKSEATLGGEREGARATRIREGAESGIITEHSHRFHIDIPGGQKTGFFLDQRDNRALVGRYARGRNVLNCFAYSGGFSVYALAGGAHLVHSVDASKPAVELLRRNIELNFPDGAPHEALTEDVLDLLPRAGNRFDLIILDPPAFVKHRKALAGGLRGYESINYQAIRQIRPDGVLFTFSCSQSVSVEVFRESVQKAAARARRQVRVLHELHQGPCHPVSLYHPEGAYLKGLVLSVA